MGRVPGAGGPRASARPGRSGRPGGEHLVGPKGQVVIPKDLRAQLGLEPGDKVTFWREGDHVAVRRATPRRPLRGRFAESDLTGELLRDRDLDRRREDDR